MRYLKRAQQKSVQSYFNIYIYKEYILWLFLFSSFKYSLAPHTTMKYLGNTNSWNPEGLVREIKLLCQASHLIFWFRKCFPTYMLGEMLGYDLVPGLNSTLQSCCINVFKHEPDRTLRKSSFNQFIKKVLTMLLKNRIVHKLASEATKLFKAICCHFLWR